MIDESSEWSKREPQRVVLRLLRTDPLMSTVLPDELFQVIAQQAGLSRPLSPSTLFRFRFQLSSSAQAGSRQTGRETASAIAS